jgi:hypothetical protein
LRQVWLKAHLFYFFTCITEDIDVIFQWTCMLMLMQMNEILQLERKID